MSLYPWLNTPELWHLTIESALQVIYCDPAAKKLRQIIIILAYTVPSNCKNSEVARLKLFSKFFSRFYVKFSQNIVKVNLNYFQNLTDLSQMFPTIPQIFLKLLLKDLQI